MYKTRSLRSQLYVSYLAAILLAVGILGWFVAATLKKQAYRDAVENLENQAILLSEMVRSELERGNEKALRQFCQSISTSLKSRITVSTAEGQVLADTQEDPSRMDNHSLRPEIRQALAGSVGTCERYSETLNARMVYVALPIRSESQLIGVVRVSRPVGRVMGSVESVYRSVLLAAVIAMTIAALPTVYFSLRIARLFRQLEEGTKKIANGESIRQIQVPAWQEVAGLVAAIDRLAEQTRDRLEALNRQRQELEAVLSSMVEAVLIVDDGERLINMNRAAALLFKPRLTEFAGRNFMEVIRNVDLQNFVKKALASGDPVEEELVIIGRPDLYLQAHGTALRHANGDRKGTLVVLNDITRLKSLEQIRKDLVTNASHELRTPVTSIKGFLETLRDGALDQPETARRFLDIMIRQSDRLAAIIEDMLTLSEIEKTPTTGAIRLEKVELGAVLNAVRKEFLPIAQEKHIDMQVQFQPDLWAMVNEHLFHQAVLNLVENAIKYTEPGGKVVVRCTQECGFIAVCVQDEGIGIPREHLSRIFERFYRVDAGRSRKMGGTGLGLAIVKHIAAAHGGEVTVQSSPGSGSRFCIHLPTSGESGDTA